MPENSGFHPRPHLSTVIACPHGGIDVVELRTLGVQRDDILDFSASTNPLGPSPATLAAIARLTPEEIARYPDGSSVELLEALASHLHMAAGRIVLGNGSAEILWLLALAYLSPGDSVVTIGPTFGEYERAAAVAGARLLEYRAVAEADFQPDLETVIASVRQERPRLVFLCNPNNPTGVLLNRHAVLELLDAVSDGLLIVDEAYGAFADDMPHLLEDIDRGNLLLLRSMTKDCGLAGLRVGYAVASEDVICALHRVQPPWSLNVMAQVAARAALNDWAHVARARIEVDSARSYLVGQLRRLGFDTGRTATNFLLVRVGSGALFRRALLERGVCVRDCASFGLPEYVRIGIRTRTECAHLFAAIEESLQHA